MNRKTTMLAGAAAAAIVVGASVSTPVTASPIPPAASYADLLEPVPDAQARLLTADAAEQTEPGRLIPVQYGYGYGAPYEHHHHHHHHHHAPRWYEQNGYYWDGYGWAPRPIYHHHHHHHHHHGWY